MDKKVIESYIEAGKIAKQVMTYARMLCLEGANYYDIAKKVENKIVTLDGKPAFPLNFSVNESAAHDTPTFKDERILKKGDLVKIDIGVHINGCIADTATSISIGVDGENDVLISAAEKALNSAIKVIKPGVKIGEIGKAIGSSTHGTKVKIIQNLTGHQLGEYMIHAGLTIPNFETDDDRELRNIAIAVEPFTTYGDGFVVEGKSSGIYALMQKRPIRIGKEILEYVVKEFKTLPFSERALVEKFGLKAKLIIRDMVNKEILHSYEVLRERSKRKVAQFEHTFLILDDKVIVTTA